MRKLQISVPGGQGRLRCRVDGCGPPLVVQAPGWGTGGALFEQTFGPLTEHFTIISFDPRGSGVSAGSWDAASIDIGQQADDLRHIVAHLNLDRFSLLGHSHGSWIALVYATRHPQSLDRLVLVGAEADHFNGFEEAQMAFIEARRARPGWATACATFERALETGFEGVVSDADLVSWFRAVLPLYAHDPEVLATAFRRCDMPPLRMAALRATMATNHLFPVLPELHLIRCPALVVTGTAEWTGVRMLADRLVSGLAQGRRLDISQAGHFPWLERPEVFFDAVGRFLVEG